MKNTKRVLCIITIVWVLVLATMFSNAWIARNWTPSISQQNITIASSSALLISLSENGNDFTQSVNLNSIFANDSFTLKQISSSDGRSFHTVNYLPTLNGGVPVFTNDVQFVEGRYIDFTFYLKRQTSNNPELATNKLVFIHPESFIKSVTDENGNDISKAIRVAITVDNNAPIILANCDDVYDGFRNTNAANPNANGQDLYRDYLNNDFTYNGNAVATQTAYSLLYYHGGRTSFDNDGDPTNDYEFTPNESRAVVRMQAGQTCKINLKIWLEGGDDTCTEGIAGKVFDFLLKFDSVDLPNAQ